MCVQGTGCGTREGMGGEESECLRVPPKRGN